MITLFRTHPEWSGVLDQIGDILRDRLAAVDDQLLKLDAPEPDGGPAIAEARARTDDLAADHAGRLALDAERSAFVADTDTAIGHAIEVGQSWQTYGRTLLTRLAERLPAGVS